MLHALRVPAVASCGIIIMACTGPTLHDPPSPISTASGPVATESVSRTAEPNASLSVDPSTGPSSQAAIFTYNIGTRPLVIPDPALDHIANGFLFAEVYSGLTRPSSEDDSLVEPDLAVSYNVSSDGLAYTFKLREDVRFSDGTPLTSLDVKWSWERALRPETNSSRASIVLGAISGADEVASGDALELEGFEIVDDATFTVKLSRLNADLLWHLADPVASVLKESNVSRWPATLEWESSDELPLGAGPFRLAVLDNFVGKAILEPNPYYRDVAPRVDAVEYVGAAFNELLDYSRAWEQGLIDNDYARDSSCEEAGFDGLMLSDGIRSQVASSATAPRLTYLAFNTAVAPYDDVDFRRALVASATVEHAEIQNLDEPEHKASGLLPPGFPGHDESSQVAQPIRERAESALAGSVYADSSGDFNLHMMPELSWPMREDFERTTANWRDWLGLEVTFTDLPYMLWEDEHALQLENGTLQMRYMNLRPRYPSPQAILGAIPNLFGPNALSQETIKLQQMLDDAGAEQDSVRRLASYQDIEGHILDRALVLPIFWNSGGSCYRVQDWVEQFRVPKWGGSLFREVALDTEHPGYPHRSVSK